MEPKSIFLFTVRALIMIIVWSMSQLPVCWDVTVDVEKILEAISMKDGDTRFNAGPWPEAPSMEQFGTPSSPPSPAACRPEVFASWEAFCKERSTLIPSSHATYSGPAVFADAIDEDHVEDLSTPTSSADASNSTSQAASSSETGM